jgi:hypothetical protein
MRVSHDPRFITEVSAVALAVNFPFPLLLGFGPITASSEYIYTRRASITILLNVAEGSPEGMYNVV